MYVNLLLMILCCAYAKIILLLFLITILLGPLISENYAYCKYIIWLEFLLRNVPCPRWTDIVCQQYDAVSLNSTCPIEES